MGPSAASTDTEGSSQLLQSPGQQFAQSSRLPTRITRRIRYIDSPSLVQYGYDRICSPGVTLDASLIPGTTSRAGLNKHVIEGLQYGHLEGLVVESVIVLAHAHRRSHGLPFFLGISCDLCKPGSLGSLDQQFYSQPFYRVCTE